MNKGRNVTIRELVDRIVDREGPRGLAVAKLAELHTKLTQELEGATEATAQARLKADLAYLEGYQEAPAAQLADLKARPLHRRRAVAAS